MGFDRRGIDQQLRRRATGRGQRVKDIRPNPFRRPTHEAIVQRLARPIDFRRVGPTPAALQDMDDPADDPPIISAGHATCISWKKRLKARELLLVEPETVAIHRWSPFGNLESQNHSKGNPFYGSGA